MDKQEMIERAKALYKNEHKIAAIKFVRDQHKIEHGVYCTLLSAKLWIEWCCDPRLKEGYEEPELVPYVHDVGYPFGYPPAKSEVPKLEPCRTFDQEMEKLGKRVEKHKSEDPRTMSREVTVTLVLDCCGDCMHSDVDDRGQFLRCKHPATKPARRQCRADDMIPVWCPLRDGAGY